MDVEVAGFKLLGLMVIGVAIVIAIGITYNNQNQNQNVLGQTLTCTGVANQMTCSTNPSNTFFANAVGAGAYLNYSKNAANTANTAGTNGNYVYYILFMALILGVVIGVLAVKRKNG
jgi:hypothetical protein